MPETEGSAQESREQVSYVKEAFKLQYNWIALAGAAAFAVVSGSALPLMLAAGVELIYLSTVPQNSRFQRLVRSWKYAEEKRRQEMKLRDLFQELPPEMRTRYANLDWMGRTIRANYSRLSSTSQILVQQMEDRLGGLLQAYLRLLHSAYQHGQYLKTVDPSDIKREHGELQRRLESESPKVQEINRRRIEILTKRLEKFEKIRENGKVINAQCAAIEEVLELVRDQSVTLRDPQQVSDQLASLVYDVEHTEETIRQVEAIFDMAAVETADAAAPLSSASSGSAPGAAPRSRVRS